MTSIIEAAEQPKVEDPIEHFNRIATNPKYAHLLQTSKGRRALTRDNPGLFAYIYLRHHLTNEHGDVTFSEFHRYLYAIGKQWINNKVALRANRDVVIAPRNSGKSTTMFLLLPMWAAAHQHVMFIAAFGDTVRGAGGNHMETFKTELRENAGLRKDFPELCAPKRQDGDTSRQVADNKSRYVAQSGFVFIARSMTESNRGLKEGNMRPQLIILDDIEPQKEKYSDYKAENRLDNLQETIFKLNEYAPVVMVGTVVMPGSIIHQIKNYELDPDKHRWVGDENLRVHYYPAIIKNPDGTERSYWPERWPMEGYMNEQRHMRQFQQEMMNNPVSPSDGFWTEDHITIGSGEPQKTIVYVDGAVKKEKHHDQTAIVVVSVDKMPGGKGKYVVKEAIGIRATFETIAAKTYELVNKYQATKIVVEDNQGGAMWGMVYKQAPVPVEYLHNKLNKEFRIAQAFVHYEQGRVLHAKHLPELEEQQYAFGGKMRTDDVLDAACTGILYISGALGKQAPKIRQASYV